MKKILLFSLGGLLLLSIVWILIAGIPGFFLPESSPNQTADLQGDFTGMGNPAAVYCQELGYEFKTVHDPKGERGVCLLPEEQECDAWDFLEGKCGQDHSYCAQQGLDTVLKHDGKNGLTQSYAVCVNENQLEVGTAVEMMDLEEKSLGCGVGLEETRTPDASRAETAPPLDFDPPAAFDWRDNDGDWLTPIRNQGVCGSCWAFAAVGVTESVINIGLDDPTEDLNLSEQYLVTDCYQEYDGYGTCCGGRKGYALDYIWSSGIPDDGCLPYVDGTGCKCLDGISSCGDALSCTYDSTVECSDRECADRCVDWAIRLVSIQDYGFLGSWAADSTIKQNLVEYGPLAVSVGIGSGVGGGFGLVDNIYRCTDDVSTNHAVVIVGYEDYLPQPPPEDPQGYWIIRNSWGTWNGDGYYMLEYGECGVNKEVYVATDNQAPNTPSDPVPADAAGDILINSDLSWTGGDPNPGDTVTYDVYFEAGNPTPGTLLCDDAGSESCDPGTLLEGITYYWQVVASDQYAESTTGPVWSFTTEAASSLSNWTGFYSAGQVRWFLKTDHEHGWNDLIAPKFGPADSTGWIPVSGDWNGDGVDYVGFYSVAQQRWFLKTDHAHGWNDLIAPKFGPADVTGWFPVSGDWNGDGIDNVGFYCADQHRWFLKTDHEHGWDNLISPKFGPADINGWIPVAGDWNGDGVDYVGFYSAAQVRWFLKTDHEHGWNDLIAPKFGPADITDWTPIAGDWNGDGVDYGGFYSAAQVRWFLKTDHAHGWNDLIAPKFGPADNTGWFETAGGW